MTLKEITEMDDLISRWEAFKAVMDDENITNAMDSANDGEMHRTKRAASRIIAGLPSAQQWIPVSERLPKNEETVIFCSVFGSVHVGQYYADASTKSWYSFDERNRVWYLNVTAWMPLPKPYEVEENDKTQ